MEIREQFWGTMANFKQSGKASKLGEIYKISILF